MTNINQEHHYAWIALTAQAKIVKITRKRDYFKLYCELATQKLIELSLIINMLNTRCRMALFGALSDICQSFQEKKRALEFIDKVMLLILRHLRTLGSKTEVC